MSDERWMRIDRLLQSALARPAHEREDFIRNACPNDAGMRDELLSLLARDRSGDTFLEPSPKRAPLPPGAQLGAYAIRALIGEGGMGEVYRAHDSRLRRDIAIKILPPEAADVERRQRFAREAQAVAALNHPGIVTIHSVEQSGDLHFLTMELVDGQTLDVLLPPGGLPIDRVLTLAIPLADAVGAAHGQGIVHRDLKPANVMVTRDGRVKVMDFGLAKLAGHPTLDDAKEEIDASVRTMSAQLTGDRRILGTAAYMSPEQAEGRDVDHRSDVFSLGILLFELATGRRPFAGDSQVAMLASIVKDAAPSVTELKPGLPAAFARLVKKCLAKDPARRYQSALDVRNDLEEIKEDLASSDRIAPAPVAQTTTPAAFVRARLGWFAAALSALAAVGFAFVAFWPRPPAEVPEQIWSLLPPAGARVGNRAISPDGTMVAFIAALDGTILDGRRQIWVQHVKDKVARPLAGTDGATQPFWSPNSKWIGFGAQGKLRKIQAIGGPAQPLCDAPMIRGGAWSSAGIIVFAPDQAMVLHRVSEDGGASSPVTTMDRTAGELQHRYPSFLPGGRRFVYTAFLTSDRAQLKVGSLDAPNADVIVRDVSRGRAVVVPRPERSGGSELYVLFQRDGSLLAQPLNGQGTATSGDPVTVAEDIDTFSVSMNGMLEYRSIVGDSNLTWFNGQDPRGTTIGRTARYGEIELSPDGTRIAATVVDPQTKVIDIWILDAVSGAPVQLTSAKANSEYPRWSPDSKQLLFSRARKDGGWSLMVAPVDVSSGEREIFGESVEGLTLGASDWGRSARGDFIAYRRVTPGTAGNLWTRSLAAGSEPVVVPQTDGRGANGRFSPDGRFLAYQAEDVPGNMNVFVRSVSGDGPWRVTSESSHRPRWNASRKELFYVRAGRLMAVAVETTPTFVKTGTPRDVMEMPIAASPLIGAYTYDVSRDGQRILAIVPVADAATSPITILTNWAAALRKEKK